MEERQDLISRQAAIETVGVNTWAGMRLAKLPAAQERKKEKGDNMTDGIMLTIGEDGKASFYDDAYDITIHCASQEEQEEVIRILQNTPHWIPVEQALPEEPFGCLVTVMDANPSTMEEFENILPYFVGWDGEQWNDADGEQCPFEILAWMPLPEPGKVNRMFEELKRHFDEEGNFTATIMEFVPVVRCIDCKWFDLSDPCGTLTPNTYRCKRVTRLWMESDAFCSYGERNTREE